MLLNCGSCTIRPWQKGDEASLAQHANNYSIWLNLRDRFPNPYTLADADWWISHATTTQPPTSFAIAVDGLAVGSIGVELQQDVERTSAEIGYWLGEAYWGRGILTAVLKNFSPWALNTYGLTRLYALPFANNKASCRVLEKAGFALEGLLKRSAIKNGKVLDKVLYAFTDEHPPEQP